MTRKLKILFVSAELAPLVSTGGLADVAAALPRALHALGHDVRVALPCYRQIPDEVRGNQHCMVVADFGHKVVHGALRTATVPNTDIPLYLVEHEGYFGREAPYGSGAYEYGDNAERFCFFCLALLHGIPQTGWIPDVIHCHDWHTAPIPAYLKTRYFNDAQWGGKPVLFTIHNLAFQGRYPAHAYAATGLDYELFTPQYLEYEGDLNLMKGALAFADKLNTVSPRYAKEIQTLEYGCGLHGMLSARGMDLYGVLNGIDYDLWNPATDPHLPAPYSIADLRNKAICKAELQRRFFLPERDVPLFGLVSRLYWQKGVDMLLDALDRVMEQDIQLVVLGSGDPDLERRVNDCIARYPGKVGVYLGYNNPLSHLIIAGSDFFLMPSRYEPCGLTQLYALAYGSIPLVHRTGGLADTVKDCNPLHLRRGDATGISYVPFTAMALAGAMEKAVALYEDPGLKTQVQLTGMRQSFSWERAAHDYITLYEQAMNEAS